MAPYPNPRPSWPSNDDTTVFNLIVIVVGVCAGSYLLWTNYHAEISAAVMTLVHDEIGVIGLVTDRYALADRQMSASDPRGVTLRDLYGILHAVGMFVRIPATALVVLLAAICTVRAAPSRYRRAFDLDGLIREQALSFPVTSAFVGRALRLVPLGDTLRPADYALTPMEWVQHFASDRDGRFDEARAKSALVAQLGPNWMGPDKATPIARLLFVAFGLHLQGRRQEALDLLGAASAALAAPKKGQPEGPEQPLALPASILARVDALLVQTVSFETAQEIAGQHAYTTPALMGLLNAARMRAGVLAPAQFAWLKLVDRPFWFALHSLGYETDGIGRYLHPNPRAEAAGARDHWAVEQVAGGPVLRPSVERAVEALRGGL
jgi:intracellular multiplication protein IcmP